MPGLTRAALAAVSETELRKLGRLAGGLRVGRLGVWAGQNLGRAAGGPGVEFLEFRDYRPGDDVRYVDWRASARREHPQLRTFRDELAAEWSVCLDSSASMANPDPLRWRLAVQLAAAFSYLLLAAGNRVGFVHFSDHLDARCVPGRGRTQYLRIARSLGDREPHLSGAGSSLDAVRRHLPDTSHLVVIGDFLAPDGMCGDLAALDRHGRNVHVLQIRCASDAELPAGTRRVVDVETGLRLAVDAGSERLARGRLERSRVELLGVCRTRRFALTSVDAGQRWQDVLVRHLGSRVRA